MGIETVAICELALGCGFPTDLPQKLQHAWTRAGETIRITEWPVNEGGNWGWRLSDGYHSAREEYEHEGWVSLTGPDAIMVTLHKSAAKICHPCRWGAFLSEDLIQRQLVSAMALVASVLGAKRLVLIPDSAYKCSEAMDGLFEGRSVDQITNWLGKTCGPPAESLSSIYTESEDSWEGDGYYILTVGPPLVS